MPTLRNSNVKRLLQFNSAVLGQAVSLVAAHWRSDELAYSYPIGAHLRHVIEHYEALLLPDAAVGTEQARKFVLTVNAENTAVPKYVTLGQTTGDNLRVIKNGIGPDDRVVVNGLLRARPGQKVTPQEQGATPSAPAQPTAQK